MKKGILTISLLLIFTSLWSQDISVYHKFDDGQLKLRWIIHDGEKWAAAVNSGFTLTKENLNTGSREDFNIEWNAKSLLPGSNPASSKAEFLALLLDENQSNQEFFESAFPQSVFNEEVVDITRRDLTDQLFQENFSMAVLAGFGFVDEEVQNNVDYRYTITNAGKLSEEGLSIETSMVFNASKYSPPSVSELQAKWMDRQAILRWNTKITRENFYGFEVQMDSSDGEFFILDSLIINPYDTSSNAIFHFLERPVLLEDNDKIYTFRVYGVDYFGDRSLYFSEVTGSGNSGIGLSPVITGSRQLKTNEVELQWSISEQFEDNVTSWNIYVGEQWEGPYFADSIGLLTGTRSVIRPIPYEDSYYRVAAVDANGDEFSSFPQLVVNVDTIPPAIPTQLEASIDSLGIVRLKWDANSEPDFYGYKVFFGFDTTREMTLANFETFPTPFFTDTIGLISENKWVYYKVISVDRRNNRSEPSAIVTLRKPDILPPVEPHFTDFQSGEGEVLLRWSTSTSEDVITQQLYRRAIPAEKEWTLIKAWALPEISDYFLDTTVTYPSQYAYLLTVEDEAGNISEPSSPVVVSVLPDHGKINLEKWRIILDEGNIGVFEHDFEDPMIEEIRIYKIEDGGPPFELARMAVTQYLFRDQNVKPTIVNEYFIRLIFKDGYQSPYSPKKILP